MIRSLFLALILFGTVATVACSESHTITIINRSKEDMDKTKLILGDDHTSLGWIPPDSDKTYIAAVPLGKEAVLEWKMGGKEHRAAIDLSDIPALFAGTVLLEVQGDATVKKSLAEPIPGLKH